MNESFTNLYTTPIRMRMGIASQILSLGLSPVHKIWFINLIVLSLSLSICAYDIKIEKALKKRGKEEIKGF